MRTEKKHLAVRVVAILLAFVLGLVIVQYSAWMIQKEQQRQVEQNLRDVAEQNESQIQIVMDSCTMLLNAMTAQMSNAADPRLLIDQMAPLVDIYNVKRIGYIAPDGNAYTTDQYHINLIHQDFFQQSIRGKFCMTDMLVDNIGGRAENVNILSAPVYSKDGETVTGVMFTTYRTSDFSDLLHVDSFGNRGTSCVVQQDGKIVASSTNRSLQIGGNLFDSLLEMDPSNRKDLDTLRNDMKRGESRQSIFSDGTNEHFFYVTAIPSNPGWYLATIVPVSVLSERTKPVLENLQRMLVCVIVLLVLCGMVYLWTNEEQNKQLLQMAYADPLTQIDNYVAFREKMRGGVGVSGAGYVVSVDLRSFGTINNTCGVAKGDELIRAMSDVLKNSLEHGELAAHVSGDCFVLFLHSPSERDLIIRMKKMRDGIAELSSLLDVPHVVPMFGIRAVDSPNRPEKSYSDANLAKQKIKDRLDCFYAIFDEETRSRALEVQRLEDDFMPALIERQFEMWYQPKYAPTSGRMVASEALVRWRHADGSLVSPGKFIPLFEKNGMIAQLDEYTFDSVCAQQRAWQDQGQRVVPASVNVSQVSLYFTDIVERYMEIIQRHGISTDCIELEITESAMVGSVNVTGLIAKFRARGFRILVDDFGSGYSSLSTLTMRCFDNIKIDKSLIDCIGVPEGDSLLESIVHLAHEFNMTVTAEGVEQASQVEFLKNLACDNIQGYYYSRPLPVDDFGALLTEPDTV